MEEKNETEKGDEVMLPGFRFHPTDEELVGFYLKRKVQQKPLSIELIKQLDIYKYDPWDLPKLATTGEKEWYFYCPRDRKYRNSARPNRVTGAGFWKATGTDRPIYSSEGSKCIGLKKSLVFYQGRAAKGIKTDWMMHEFRLPSPSDSTHSKRTLDKNIPPSDSWAICRIFKKTSSMAQRALSHSWVSSNLPQTTTSGIYSRATHNTNFGLECISGTTEDGSGTQFDYSGLQESYMTGFPSSDVSFYKPTNPNLSKPPVYPIFNSEVPSTFMFSSLQDVSTQPSKCNEDVASMLLNLPPSILGDNDKSPPSIDFSSYQLNNNMGGIVSAEGMNVNVNVNVHGQEHETSLTKNSEITDACSQWGTMKTISFPFSLGSSPTTTWKPSMPWDSPSCPSEMSTNKCYT